MSNYVKSNRKRMKNIDLSKYKKVERMPVVYGYVNPVSLSVLITDNYITFGKALFDFLDKSDRLNIYIGDNDIVIQLDDDGEFKIIKSKAYMRTLLTRMDSLPVAAFGPKPYAEIINGNTLSLKRRES